MKVIVWFCQLQKHDSSCQRFVFLAYTINKKHLVCCSKLQNTHQHPAHKVYFVCCFLVKYKYRITRIPQFKSIEICLNCYLIFPYGRFPWWTFPKRLDKNIPSLSSRGKCLDTVANNTSYFRVKMGDLQFILFIITYDYLFVLYV